MNGPEALEALGAPDSGDRAAAAGRGAPGPKLRSRRTAATCVVVTAVVIAAGALLYDVIAVRTGHPAREWRSRLAHQLATRHLDDIWVLTAAGVAVLLGALLCTLAFAPGLRRWLALEPAGAAIHRGGVAALIAERAAELPDVHGAKVKVTRRATRVTVTGAHDPAAVERALRAELARIPLAAPHRLDVRTRTVRSHGPHHRKALEQEP
ncbi:hypothetical protein GCM10010441_49570 [Kitasatospora paracochleata]|uniref:DUF6286 domain-containing protein n=1 Tax=Kitasatospora paracochleata TaxID=58354 RepID=A0ABT1ISN3_9ACTN|nr:DUF6286 domain-containing protein [Kitasatospora paracochleata]MCP2308148.1 hypothetical protein [Kitasatospora paracochleata]